MNDLHFRVLGSRAEPHAIAPTLMFKLAIDQAAGPAVHTIMLATQIRMQPQQRRYTSSEQHRLLDLFGEPPRWGETVKPIVFSHVSTIVPGFERKIDVELPVPCSYDFEVASAKYLHALEDGEIPLLFLFSGTIFSKREAGEAGFNVQQVRWDREASYRMPVSIWREAIDQHYQGCGWIRLRKESLDAMQRFRAEGAYTSWDEAVADLLGRTRKGGAG